MGFVQVGNWPGKYLVVFCIPRKLLVLQFYLSPHPWVWVYPDVQWDHSNPRCHVHWLYMYTMFYNTFQWLPKFSCHCLLSSHPVYGVPLCFFCCCFFLSRLKKYYIDCNSILRFSHSFKTLSIYGKLRLLQIRPSSSSNRALICDSFVFVNLALLLLNEIVAALISIFNI